MKRTQPWTDCLGHKSSMDIASVISFFLATALLKAYMSPRQVWVFHHIHIWITVFGYMLVLKSSIKHGRLFQLKWTMCNSMKLKSPYADSHVKLLVCCGGRRGYFYDFPSINFYFWDGGNLPTTCHVWKVALYDITTQAPLQLPNSK